MIDIKTYYQKRLNHYKSLAESYSKKNRNFSLLRVIWFFTWVVAIWLSTYYSMAIVTSAVFIGLIVFVILVVFHNKILAKKKSYEIYEKLNAQELKAIRHDYQDFEDGAEFIDEKHYYTHDLDVFGSFSLFQFINRSFSQLGRENFAQRLSFGFKSKAKIEEQQEAIEELSKHSEWMQDFQVLGHLTQSVKSKKQSSVEQLAAWAKRKGFFSRFIFKIAVVLIPLLSWTVFAFLLLGEIQASSFLLYLVVPIGFSGLYAARIIKNHNELSKQTEALQRWYSAFSLFENKTFESSAIKNLQSQLQSNEETAGQAIKKLASLSQAFDTRLNLIGWLLLNYFFSWDILQSIRLEKWRDKYGKNVKAWFDALAELESLISLAAFNYNHQEMVFPNIKEEGFVFNAKEAAHPLIPPKGRVSSDIEFSNSGSFTIVTGANMAGKSTYLRNVGANMILAYCGAPVCAKEMEITPIQLFTSIKTKDSLAKNESYFYAELLRLQSIIDELKKGERLFIILDEILKGTNSKDKEMGSKALVKQLIELKAVGIIATHDLQLGELIKEFPEHIKNRCFEVDIHNDQLHFDYRLRGGVSQNLNATFLMNKMGITGV